MNFSRMEILKIVLINKLNIIDENIIFSYVEDK